MISTVAGKEPLRLSRFVPRYLDPASRLGEVLFGLIMVLTMTLTAGLTVAEGKEGVRQLLLAAIGCNVAYVHHELRHGAK